MGKSNLVIVHSQDAIHYVSLSTMETGVLLHASSDRIAIDWLASNLYYSSLETHALWVCNLKQEVVCTTVITDGVAKPRAVALYPSKG